MNRKELLQLWSEILRSPDQTTEQYDRLAQAVVDVYQSDDPGFNKHVKDRFGRVTKATGQSFNADNFNIDMARALVADEIGFSSWDQLIRAVQNPDKRKYPLLFNYAIAALWRGDFTKLERMVGGSEVFDGQIVDWYEKGYFSEEAETFAEVFAAACMLGHERTAGYLLDKSVDPYAGMRTGLAGFHYAASSGRPEVVKTLIERKVPMEVENTYGGTVLGQALWSAINEHNDNHAEIVELLVDAGAYVWPDTLEWWQKQDVPSAETKERITNVLRRRESETPNNKIDS